MLSILYEDNHLLVVNKPAAVATMGAESGPTVYSLVGDYLKKKYNKPGNVFVGIVSRLDSMTTGVLVVARTSKGASRLTPQFAPIQIQSAKATRKTVARADKIYLAVVEGDLKTPLTSPDQPQSLVDWVRKDDAAHRMRVVAPNAPGAQQAELQFIRLAETNVGGRDATILAVRLRSGRKHQIRLQFAHRGSPVWADRKYGGEESLSKGIGLHSFLLRIDHPTLKQRMQWLASVPASWKALRGVLPSDEEIRETLVRAFQLPPLATNDSQ